MGMVNPPLTIPEDNSTPSPLAKLSAAIQALADAKTLDQVKHIMDVAEAARTYARAAKLGLEAANHAAEVKLRAERKAGELLRQLERASAGRPQIAAKFSGNSSQAVTNFQKTSLRSTPHPAQPENSFQPSTSAQGRTSSEYQEVLAENDINRMTASRWMAVATVPDEAFEELIAETVNAGDRELTSALALRKAQELKRGQHAASMAAAPELPTGRYRVIYADPPWKYNNSGVITANDAYGRAARHYPTMSLPELMAMGETVRNMADDDAVLFFWVTSPFLADCFDVIRSWGFQYKTSFVWDKIAHNFGHYNSVRHEFLLVCTRGSCTPDTPTLYDSVVSIQRTEHSVKPDEFRRMIDDLYPHGRRIELFARCTADGWEAWGNQA